MAAMPIRVAATDRPRQMASASTSGASCVDMRSMRGRSRLTSRGPMKIRNPAKPSASAVTTPRWSQRMPPPPARLATTARMIMPRMSSKTAAPRMMRAVRVPSTCRSRSTRAVMPTLVATMAAATKIDSCNG